MPLSISELKDDIAGNSADHALAKILDATRSPEDQEWHNQAIHFWSRWEANKKKLMQQVVTREEYNLENNRINQALLAFVDALPAGIIDHSSRTTTRSFRDRLDSADTETKTRSEKNSAAEKSPAGEILWKKIGYAALLATLLSGLADLFGLVHIFSGGSEQSLQLTVYVHGPRGQSDVVLQNTGKLLITLDNDRRAALIGENGRTNFGEIPVKFRDREILIGLEAEGYEPAFPDKKYRLDDKPVFLEIRRDNSLGLIQGIVKDRSGEQFLVDALVMIDQDTTVRTDSLGRFRLLLPAGKHRDRYLLTVKKEGFKTRTDYFLPKTGPLEVRLEK